MDLKHSCDPRKSANHKVSFSTALRPKSPIQTPSPTDTWNVNSSNFTEIQHNGSPKRSREESEASSRHGEKSVVTPFLMKHINDQSNIPKDNIHKFCYRHNPDIVCNKQADAVKMKAIQSCLEQLPPRDREAISHVWSIFSAAPHAQRALILKGLVSQCCFPQLSTISQEINQLIRIDFIATLPVEISLKILCYLDCKSLCDAAQVSRKWKELADDDRVWHHMCEQHIDRKCPNCGWGLPLMHMRRARENTDGQEHDAKRQKGTAAVKVKKRPWKSVYSERYQLEKNWRNGTYSVTEFFGHTDGITCLQFNNKFLISGSYDSTVRIWNIDTGECVRTLSGHSKGVRSLSFDSHKLITGGYDSTIKVWNYRTGECISTYRGHESTVCSVDASNRTIVSGSADSTVKVWHVDTRTCYTLRGHTECVNSVKFHEQSNTLFSASDDTTVRMWDLSSNSCIRVFGGIENKGHVGQIETVIPFVYKFDDLVTDKVDSGAEVDHLSLQQHEYEQQRHQSNADGSSNSTGNTTPQAQEMAENPNYPTHLLTSSLDNTIKLWDVKTGKCIRTQFGHIEGVWSISADTFRIVSGAHDKLIKVWDLQNGKCLHTFGNDSSVISVALSSNRFVAGLDNGKIKMYNFE
ncbi:hypothetical protein OXX79_005596 [Metschnikowia pulcherrima]